ncbi:MAG TPA: glycoside hydrolase family 9 protein [Puia sp.]|jgi:endoglucanase
MRVFLLVWLVLMSFCLDAQVPSVNPSPSIVLNQIGFYPDAPKLAVVILPVSSDSFFVIGRPAGDTAFSGKLGVAIASANSSLMVRLADLSGLNREGTYNILVPGLPHSLSFTVERRAMGPVAAAALKGYYYQRVSMPLESVYAGAWARGAGHPDRVVFVHSSAATAARPAGTVISSPGGWYDAGDYNKYVVNSGITMGTLFDAYEDYPVYFDTLRTGIPPVQGLPDILNEALYNLRWMLTMQDPGDSGVYHKCTNAAFDGMVKPGVTKAPRYVVQKSTAATLDFAAVMAQASRIFRKYPGVLPGLADSCLQAARGAWGWAVAHPAVVYDQDSMNKLYQPAITTGAYGDKKLDDERFWAAAELFVSTGEAPYQRVAKEGMVLRLTVPSWGNVGMMGVYSLLRPRVGVGKDLAQGVGSGMGQEWRQAMAVLQQRLLHFADSLVRRQSAFHTVMGGRKSDFVWGSNAVAANQGMLLLKSWLLKKDKKYLNAALDNLDYILGRNATGYCFVTGLGGFSPLHPHHRPSISDGVAAPVPGLLVGGPNPGRQDHQVYPFFDAELAYIDNDQAYASNEIAINWNAPLVYLAGGIDAVKRSDH